MTPSRSNGYIRVNLRFTGSVCQVCEQQPPPLKSYQVGRRKTTTFRSRRWVIGYIGPRRLRPESRKLLRGSRRAPGRYSISGRHQIFSQLSAAVLQQMVCSSKFAQLEAASRKLLPYLSPASAEKGRIGGGEGGKKGGKRRAFNESAAPDSSCQRRAAVCRTPKTPQHASPRPL